MKAQLVKRQDRFDLYNESDGSKIASTLPNPMGKLSLKNCEAIENGYDLDELADELTEHFNTFDAVKSDIQVGFKAGFQKALELLGNKKFSEKDMSKAWSEGYHRKVDGLNGNGLRYFDKFIQSLQQTEWDVEVEMDICGDKVYAVPEPKLDENGCLILKRK